MITNCTDCNRPLGQQSKEYVSTEYSSITKTLIVTKTTIKTCLKCKKHIRVLPIETTAKVKVLASGKVEVEQ